MSSCHRRSLPSCGYFNVGRCALCCKGWTPLEVLDVSWPGGCSAKRVLPLCVICVLLWPVSVSVGWTPLEVAVLAYYVNCQYKPSPILCPSRFRRHLRRRWLMLRHQRPQAIASLTKVLPYPFPPFETNFFSFLLIFPHQFLQILCPSMHNFIVMENVCRDSVRLFLPSVLSWVMVVRNYSSSTCPSLLFHSVR